MLKKINKLGWNYKTELIDGLIKTYEDYKLTLKKLSNLNNKNFLILKWFIINYS